MVKTTYALTLFAAVSLAAPIANPDGSGNLIGAGADSALTGAVEQLTGKLDTRETKKTSNEHKNLIEEIPIIGSMLGNKHSSKRATSDTSAEHKNLIDEIPIVGGLLGSHEHSGGNNGLPGTTRRSTNQNYHQNDGQNDGQNDDQNDGQNDGQNAGQNDDQNDGQNDLQNSGQNEGQNSKRDLSNLNSLSSLPLVGDLFGKDKDQGKPSHQQTDGPAKKVITRQEPGHAKGIFGILESITSGGPQVQHHQRSFTPDETTVEDGNGKPIGGDKKDTKGKDGKDSKKPDTIFSTLMGPEGLGSLKGNSDGHGIGLLGSRNTEQIEARTAPIQGSTLTDVLFSGGALGKLSDTLTPGQPKHEPGQSDSYHVGDGTASGPPDPASGAGPHSGPGYDAEKQQTGASKQGSKGSQGSSPQGSSSEGSSPQ
ncbi:unnamed protein product [Penicillium salamii]|uniref:Uncharacterized protein n=1 Tax=Penicillium salamii TaxID=1612424 RepID=A0A9W4JH87_9EURO|nr:unnamed protein product [Penicillium salamii]CAG8245789.1 unnamed protein product [Penicillium salamii]CAG8320658.1 unnamed protein product [Penicillium salamii]CAG8320871.1 unnamed protein product [Penicillium salamii]CAG8399476.1 unnamed protein product [Penicillium salamii]